MKEFLDLSLYKKRTFTFPNHLNPKIESNFVGIINNYVKLSESIYGKNIFETFHRKEDKALLQKLVLRDGVFFGKFYEKYLRLRVNTYFNSLRETSGLILMCNEYYQKEYRESTAIKIIKEDFIKTSLNNLKNQSLFQELKKSIKTFSETKKCEI
jgi:hypothetical protein